MQIYSKLIIMLSETIDFLFPKFCLGCNVIISKHQNLLCEPCKHSLPCTHWNFDSDNYIYSKLKPYINLYKATSLLRFHNKNETQNLLHQLKYGGQQNLGVLFAEMLAPTFISENNLPDSIVPIPIHPKKLKIRGYNQLDVFGNSLAKILNISFNSDVLKRSIHQESQTLKSRKERLIRIKNSFKLNNTDKTSKHILLIDDVCTTGATLIYCANLLLKIPDIKVSVATISTVY